MVDILLVLLCFFIVTWSFARKEMELDVKVPAAQSGKESNPGRQSNRAQREGGRHRGLESQSNLALGTQRRSSSSSPNFIPDYAIILRGDERAEYKSIVSVLDMCRDANIWNVAFATGKVE